MLSEDSGGGFFFLGAALTALAGVSSFCLVFSSYTSGTGSTRACEEADMVELFAVSFDSCQMSIFCWKNTDVASPDAKDKAERGCNSHILSLNNPSPVPKLQGYFIKIQA